MGPDVVKTLFFLTLTPIFFVDRTFTRGGGGSGGGSGAFPFLAPLFPNFLRRLAFL